MLKHISTVSFIEAVLLVTLVYYLVVAAVFYRSDIKRIIRSRLIKEPGPPGKD